MDPSGTGTVYLQDCAINFYHLQKEKEPGSLSAAFVQTLTLGPLSFMLASSLYETIDSYRRVYKFETLAASLAVDFVKLRFLRQVPLLNVANVLTQKGSQGETLFHVAVGCGNLEAIKFIQQYSGKAAKTQIDNNGNTPFHYLGKWTTNIVQVTKILLNLGMNIFSLNYDRESVAHILPTHLPNKCVYEEWVNEIVSRNLGQLFNLKDKLGRTPLHRAVEYFDITGDLLSDICRKESFDMNSRDNAGLSILHIGALYGRSKISLTVIVECGCDPHVKDVKGRSVLHFSVWGGNLDSVNYFLELDVSVNGRDNFGRTPLHYICFSPMNHVQITDLMREMHADIYAIDHDGKTIVDGIDDASSQQKFELEVWKNHMNSLYKSNST